MNATQNAKDFKWAAWVDDFPTSNFETMAEHYFETKDELQAFLMELE